MDVSDNDVNAHVLQTPGTDTTLADANIGDVVNHTKPDVKVQLPNGTAETKSVTGTNTGKIITSDVQTTDKALDNEAPVLGTGGKELDGSPTADVCLFMIYSPQT